MPRWSVFSWAIRSSQTYGLNSYLQTQKTVRLSRVESMTKEAVKIEQLKERVDLALREDQAKTED